MNRWKTVANIRDADGRERREEIIIMHPSAAEAFSQGQAVLLTMAMVATEADAEINGAWCYWAGETGDLRKARQAYWG